MNVRFFLRSSKKEPKTIWYDVTWSSNRLSKTTRLKCHSKDWIEENKRGKIQRTKSDKINYIIDELENKIHQIFITFRLEGITRPTKEQVLSKINGTHENKDVSLFTAYDAFLEDHKYKITSRGTTLAHGTYVHLKSVKNKLERFCKETGYNLDFHTCNMEFYGKYRAWRMKQGISVNTFSHTDIKKLKVFLEWAAYQEYPVLAIYKKFESPYRQTEVHTLTADKILETWNRKSEKHLDAWLFMMSSCMRVSDYNQFCKEGKNWIQDVFIDGVKKKVIVYKSQKTGKICYVPFEDDLYFRPVYLFNKYKGALPSFSGQRLNEWLNMKYSGIAKFKLTTKIARKTGATQRRRMGWSLENIMKVTGHTTESSLRHYLGMNVEDVMRESEGKAQHLKVS